MLRGSASAQGEAAPSGLRKGALTPERVTFVATKPMTCRVVAEALELADRPGGQNPVERLRPIDTVLQGLVPITLDVEPCAADEFEEVIRLVMAPEHRSTEPVVLPLLGRAASAERCKKQSTRPEPTAMFLRI